MTAEPRVRGRWFRVLKPQFAHEPLSGTGAQLMGGRYNRKGTPALYLSADPQTAYAEYTQNLYDRPGLMCSYDVDVGPAVDLTDSSVLGRYGVSEAQLAGGWIGVPDFLGQLLSERLVAEGIAAAIYPSSQRSGGRNVVIWRWRGEHTRVILIDRLSEAPTKPQ